MAIVNLSEDANIGMTTDGIITTWNLAAERMYGYVAEEIIGQPITILCPPDQSAEDQEILRKVSSGERVPYHETTRQRKDGSVFPVSVTVSPILDDRRGGLSAHRRLPAISLSGIVSKPSFASGRTILRARTGTWRPSPIRFPMTCVPRCERWAG